MPRKIRQPTSIVQLELPKQQEHRYSFSQVDTYLKCPRKYKYRYIDKIKKIVFAPAMIFGSYFHKYIEQVLGARLRKSDPSQTQRDIIKHQMFKEFQTKYLEDKKLFVSSKGDNEEIVIPSLPIKDLNTQFISLANHWDKEILPEFDPISVEKEIITDINGIPFIMYIDAIRKYKGSPQVIDWKVSKRSKGDALVKTSLQLSIYSAVTKIPNVAFCSIIRPDSMKKWEPRIDINQVTRHPNEVAWAIQVVESAVENIKQGSFPICSPENFLCTSSFCDYWDICRGKYAKPETKNPSWVGV